MSEADEGQSIKLVEENASIEKRRVIAGRVRVSTSIDIVEQHLREDLKTDFIEVTRVAKDELLELPPVTRTEGDLTVIPVVEEILFVEKRLVLKEEIHIRRRTKTERTETPDSIGPHSRSPF